MIQRVLDVSYWLRLNIAASITYLNLYAYGINTEYNSVIDKRYYRKHLALNLDSVGDIDTILEATKDELKSADERRTTTANKCTTLLIMSIFLTSLIIALDQYNRAQILTTISLLLLLNTITLLIPFNDITNEEQVIITQEDITLNSLSLKKALINDYKRVKNNRDNHTDYLVDVYKVARFCFMLSMAPIFMLILKSQF
jgi:hypothetical protein